VSSPSQLSVSQRAQASRCWQELTTTNTPTLTKTLTTPTTTSYHVLLLVVLLIAAAALVCWLFVVIVLLGLLVWLIRTGDDDGHGDNATRLRVFGGACWALGHSLCVRVFLPLGCRVFRYWTGCPDSRAGGVRVVAGRVGAWVGGWQCTGCVATGGAGM
jgi:hypothetical protein